MTFTPDRSGGKRDLTLNLRHRRYGGNVPFTDIDCLRYDRGVPVALEEWKYGGPGGVTRQTALGMLKPGQNPNVTASLNLAATAALPYFITRHWGEAGADLGHWRFDVIPGNERARTILPEPTEMSEKEYVVFIHRLGGHEPDRGVERAFERYGH